MEEDTLEELAVEEILKDLKRGAERAREHGALGWQKNPAPPTNKTFLRNMLVSTLRDNRPLGFQHKLHNTGPADSSTKQQDRFPVPKKDSETYFRYNDKHPTKARLRSVDSDKGDALLSSPHRTRCPEKRPRESSCDSKDERKNGDSKNSGRGAKKRHKRTAAGESSRETAVKKKNKKSKKSKKHKSKKSGRSAKHKS